MSHTGAQTRTILHRRHRPRHLRRPSPPSPPSPPRQPRRLPRQHPRSSTRHARRITPGTSFHDTQQPEPHHETPETAERPTA